MGRIYIVVLLLVSISSISLGQILDGIFIPEHDSEGDREPYINYENLNTIFKISQRVFTMDETAINDSLHNRYMVFDKAPLKLKNCVFINPIMDFVNTDHITGGTGEFFCLNEYVSKSFETARTKYTLPNSIRFYIDVDKVKIDKKKNEFIIDSGYQAPYDKYLTPFYFAKYEINNGNYRQFTNWVQDSLIFNTLANHFLKNESAGREIFYCERPVNVLELDEESKGVIEHLYLPEKERFNRRKEYDTRHLMYTYKDQETGKSRTVNVYPDTTVWVHDFDYAYNEPLTNLYYWHPAYDNYPVVGVSYYQAMAFMDWMNKTNKEQIIVDGVEFKMQYDLPTEAQWDMVATAKITNKKVLVN